MGATPQREIVDHAVAPGDAWAVARVALTYIWRHGRVASLERPRRFTEWVQWRKLVDRDPRFPRLADKVAVKAWVAAQLGREWVTPTLWSGIELPAFAPVAAPFVVKSRHGCNQRAFVRSGREDWAGITHAARGWIKRAYGTWLDEWLYTAIPREAMIEPFIGDGRTLPIDYKFYVFAGRVAAVQVHLEREGDHRWMLFDTDWQLLSRACAGETPPQPPRSLSSMLAAAAHLGRDFDFVRVDFYDVDGRARFGEMTFYPGSGLDPFDPPTLDQMLGDHWTAARRQLGLPVPDRIAAVQPVGDGQPRYA